MSAGLLGPMGFTAQLSTCPFFTSYKSLQAGSNVSAVSSHASVKQFSRAEVMARTVHLRCLPPFMPQKILADVFDECGEYVRVRICGNAATHQKWVYGFVEFSSTEAAEKMITHTGMELPNGPDKAPLRLKCSRSKQPILDCMAYDADVVSGAPCGFGRGYLADCTLNDALLVVGSSCGGGSAMAATPCAPAAAAVGVASTTASLSSISGTGCAGGGGGGVAGRAVVNPRVKAANDALTALTVRSIRKVAATGSGCGCAGVNCCGCCQCWRAPAEGGVTGAGGETSQGESLRDLSSALMARSSASGCCGGGASAAAAATLVVPPPGPACAPGHSGATAAVSTFAGLQAAQAAAPAAAAAAGAPLDIMQQLAAAFQGLREAASATQRPLDGLSIVQEATTMTLDALYRASYPTSDTRIQDILDELTQLLAYLDRHATVTGGAAQTASGDCTAAVPQRVTQLRLLVNLTAAMLCLLRRSVADAVPYVETILVTFAQIPPSTLLLRVRQHERASVAGAAASAGAPTQRVAQRPLGAPGLCAARDAAADSNSGGATVCPVTGSPVKKRRAVPSFPPEALVDEDLAGPLLDMVDEDDDEGEDDDEEELFGSQIASHRDGPLQGAEGDTDPEEVEGDGLLRARTDSMSTASDASAAYMNHADMVDLCDRDEGFTRYVLNVIASVGIAMEEVHPVIARSAYTLANARATEVLGESSQLIDSCLAASPPNKNPNVCAALFGEAAQNGRSRDITFFPHCFFETASRARQLLREMRGSQCYLRGLPPNHLVVLFKA